MKQQEEIIYTNFDILRRESINRSRERQQNVLRQFYEAAVYPDLLVEKPAGSQQLLHTMQPTRQKAAQMLAVQCGPEKPRQHMFHELRVAVFVSHVAAGRLFCHQSIRARHAGHYASAKVWTRQPDGGGDDGGNASQLTAVYIDQTLLSTAQLYVAEHVRLELLAGAQAANRLFEPNLLGHNTERFT